MPAPGRSTWKGFLRLSLVTCAVRLVPATTGSARISFHQLNRKTNDRVRIRLVDEATEETVDRADIVKGYEVEKATMIIERRAGHWNAADYEDRYQEALQKLVDAKIAGTKPAVPHARAPSKVVNLFDALRKSVAESGADLPAAGAKRPASTPT